jgi:hypothetical protein
MSSSSTVMWLVGSQQGCFGTLDDCIIHGIFHDKTDANACIEHLQNRNPEDMFGLIAIPISRPVHVRFNLNQSWHWFKPLQSNDTQSTGGSALGLGEIPTDITTSDHTWPSMASTANSYVFPPHTPPRKSFSCSLEKKPDTNGFIQSLN